MPKAKASLETLDALLTHAEKLLDRAAKQCRDLDFNSSVNIRRCGEAIVCAAEIQNDIYAARPDLTPEWMKKKPEKPNKPQRPR